MTVNFWVQDGYGLWWYVSLGYRQGERGKISGGGGLGRGQEVLWGKNVARHKCHRGGHIPKEFV